MRLRTIAFAASMLITSATFTASFAESAVVSEQGFDWIFFAIVGIPLVLALLELFAPGLSERLIRERPDRDQIRRL
jgi:hypothetical protein